MKTEKENKSWTMTGSSTVKDVNSNILQGIKDGCVRIAANSFFKDHFQDDLTNKERYWISDLLVAWENWKEKKIEG